MVSIPILGEFPTKPKGKFGAKTDHSGSDLFCQTVSIFDQFPVNNALVHSQIICGASAWAASSIYRNVLSTSTCKLFLLRYRSQIRKLIRSATSLSTITAATSPSTNTAAAPPSQQLASSMPASTQSNIASAPAPSPSLEWIAGAVIGPIVGIASIALLIWLLLRSRRKRQQNNMANGTMPGAHTYAQTDPNTFPHFPHFPHEMYGSNDTQPKVHEMYVRHTDDNLQELPAHECTDRR